MKIAVSGASGKTGYRVAEEALKNGYQVRLITRENSFIPTTLESCERYNINLLNSDSIDIALKGCEALIIATGARPSIDLTSPAKVDACGLINQVKSCNRVGVKRVILISSLCAGKFFHPLNLFGLILIWKKVGERNLQDSNLEWTILRPGGLNENEDNLNDQNIYYTFENKQEEGSIPRRILAKLSIEALRTEASKNKIIEITSNQETKKLSLKEAIKVLS